MGLIAQLRYIATAALSGLLLLTAAPAAAQDFPKLSGRVVDQADIIPAAEEAKRQRLAAGELGLDIYDMRGRLAAMGLKYV